MHKHTKTLLAVVLSMSMALLPMGSALAETVDPLQPSQDGEDVSGNAPSDQNTLPGNEGESDSLDDSEGSGQGEGTPDTGNGAEDNADDDGDANADADVNADDDVDDSADPGDSELNSIGEDDVEPAKEESAEEEESASSEDIALLSLSGNSAVVSSDPGRLGIISNVNSQKPLDIAGGSTASGANVQQYSGNNTPAQRFRVESAGNGYYYIVNVQSGKALDVANGSKKPGANVQQYAGNKTAAQKWMFVSAEDGKGSYYIVSALSGAATSLKDALVLDVSAASKSNGANVQLYPYNGSAAQRFTMSVIEQTVANGTYKIQSALSSGSVVDIAAGSFSNGGNAQLYAWNNTLAQKFVVTYNKNTGYYSIKNANSAKVLDVSGALSSNGANVQQYSSNSSNAQAWSIESAGSGAYRLRSACGGLVLDAAGGSSKNGTNLQLYAWNNTAAQKWSFAGVNLVSEGAFTVKSALGTVLDAANGGEAVGTNIQAYTSNGTMAQKYYLYKVGNGYYRIESMKSGLAVSLASNSGSNVCLRSYAGENSQLWSISVAGDGCFYLKNKATGNVLDISGGSSSNGANVQTYGANYTKAQKWKFVSTSTIPAGMYSISSALSASKVLDIANGSSSDGAALQIYDSNGTAAQRFQVSSVGSGWYRISCLGSGKSLDVKGGAVSSSDGSGTVQQWTSSSATAQKWKFVYAGGGYVTIYSACGDGKSCLDVAGALSANGTPVGVYRSNGTAAQKFKLKEETGATYIQYKITLANMVSYQRSNSYIKDVSDSALRSALNPSNSSGSAFFQFADLRVGSGLTGSQLNSFIAKYGSGGVLSGKGSAFASAAQKYGLNEAYLTAHTCLESGWGKSKLAQGRYYNGKGYWYTGKDGKQYWASLTGYKAGTYYNLFGIGAYDSDPDKYGVEAAIKNGWNSVDNAIYGAASWIAKNYVYASSYPQVTLYEMKWDVARSNAIKAYGWHQYATDIQWAKSIANLMGECYSSAGASDPDIAYRIPSYA